MENNSSERNTRLANLIKNQAAVFFNKYANRQAMITVTGVETSRDHRNATVFISVLPSEKSKAALDFAERHQQDFRDHLKKNAKPSRLPKIRFSLDNSPKQEL